MGYRLGRKHKNRRRNIGRPSKKADIPKNVSLFTSTLTIWLFGGLQYPIHKLFFRRCAFKKVSAVNGCFRNPENAVLVGEFRELVGFDHFSMYMRIFESHHMREPHRGRAVWSGRRDEHFNVNVTSQSFEFFNGIGSQSG